MKSTRRYDYRGPIERGDSQSGYHWVDGYSETTENGRIYYPWMTRAECRQDAKGDGYRAVFSRDGQRTS